jgi:hypothetical protein
MNVDTFECDATLKALGAMHGPPVHIGAGEPPLLRAMGRLVEGPRTSSADPHASDSRYVRDVRPGDSRQNCCIAPVEERRLGRHARRDAWKPPRRRACASLPLPGLLF